MNAKNRHRIAAGVLFSALAFTGASFAQSGGSTQADARRNADTARSAASTEAVAQPRAMRASKLIGADVENAKGENLGEIKDLVVDAQNERVRYAVLSHGGVMGIGDKLFAYPVSMLQARSGDADEFVLDVNKEKLEQAPGFDKNKWPDWGDNAYTSRIDQYYGASGRVDGQRDPKMVLASDLIGKNLDDRAGKDAGEIDDLIVDASTGRVQYAVVDFDDSWTQQAEDQLVAIPLSSIAVSGEKNDKLVIDVPRERIDMSLAFSKDRWPDFNDPSWTQKNRNRAPSRS